MWPGAAGQSLFHSRGLGCRRDYRVFFRGYNQPQSHLFSGVYGFNRFAFGTESSHWRGHRLQCHHPGDGGYGNNRLSSALPLPYAAHLGLGNTDLESGDYNYSSESDPRHPISGPGPGSAGTGRARGNGSITTRERRTLSSHHRTYI